MSLALPELEREFVRFFEEMDGKVTWRQIRNRFYNLSDLRIQNVLSGLVRKKIIKQEFPKKGPPFFRKQTQLLLFQ